MTLKEIAKAQGISYDRVYRAVIRLGIPKFKHQYDLAGEDLDALYKELGIRKVVTQAKVLPTPPWLNSLEGVNESTTTSALPSLNLQDDLSVPFSPLSFLSSLDRRKLVAILGIAIVAVLALVVLVKFIESSRRSVQGVFTSYEACEEAAFAKNKDRWVAICVERGENAYCDLTDVQYRGITDLYQTALEQCNEQFPNAIIKQQ